MHISRMPAAVTGVLRNPATPSRRTFPPFMICNPDERKNTFHGRMLRTGLGGDGSWTVRRNRSRRPWRSGAGGCGRCMVSEGDLPVAGGRMTDERMREMREKGERGMRGTTLIVRSPVRPWSKYGRTGTGFRLTISLAVWPEIGAVLQNIGQCISTAREHESAWADFSFRHNHESREAAESCGRQLMPWRRWTGKASLMSTASRSAE